MSDFKIGDRVFYGWGDEKCGVWRGATVYGHPSPCPALGEFLCPVKFDGGEGVSVVYSSDLRPAHCDENPESDDSEMDDLRREIAELREEVQALREGRNQTPIEEADEWPKHGDAYWFVTGRGEVRQSLWSGSNFGGSLDMQAMGNVFRTKEEAEAHVDRTRTMAILRRHAAGYTGAGENCYMLQRDPSGWAVKLTFCGGYDAGAVYFPTESAARAALNEVGQEALNRLMGED